ncbi:hypothetical protein [Pseudomarimonas arenosa]|uniref:Uncharacterized protein n=1 Tax=Pseudomarimonas arenosa TaxID=2774145 RepID=A0AAW3ZMF9_9GAMM|nr:hypothetical protein [Pseudomarimonas arenosa]MBD8527251.1 hypothetical protein [Pseudomarimonas arenosa]
MGDRWRSRGSIAVGAVLLASLLGLWLGRDPVAPETAPMPPKPSSFAALHAFPEEEKATVRPAAEVQEMAERAWALSPSAPLRQRLPSLLELARAGDREAACWLALEYSQCHTLAVIHNVGRNFHSLLEHRALPGVSAQQEDDLLLGIADAGERHGRSAEHCQGISEFEANPGVPLLQDLAQQGSVRLKVVAALMQPNGSLLRLPRSAVIPLTLDTSTDRLASQFYADHALPYLQQGFRAGDALALEGLILIHAPDVIHLSDNTDVAFRLPNPRLFAALALLAEQVYGGEMLGPQARNLLQRTLEQMSPTDRLALERDVQIEALRWQGTAQPAPEQVDWDYQAFCR